MKTNFKTSSKAKIAKNRGKLIIRARASLPILFLCVWVFVSVVAAQLLVGWLTILIVGKNNAGSPAVTAIYSLISYLLALALIIFVPTRFVKKWKTSREELGLKELPTWTDIGLAPVGFVVSLILAAGLAAVFSIFPWFNINEAQNVGFSAYLAGGEKLVAFVTLVILAPTVEEVIFRGFLYGKLRVKLGAVSSILITSLIFAILHFQWNVGVNVFALSVVLCTLREVTGTIYASILTHMIKNGVAFYLLYVLGI